MSSQLKSDGSVFNTNIDDSNRGILVEQYKLYVDSANQTSRLRSQTNTFFLTINTILISFLTGILEFSSQINTSSWLIAACVVGILLNVNWYFTIRSYRSINSGRFAVIQELETKLPARIYEREWELVLSKRDNKARYLRLTYIEQIIPAIFGFLYILLVVLG